MGELYKVGDGVEMQFDNGAVTLYSNGGILWPDWFERTSITRWKVESIRVAEGTVKLPEDARGIDIQKMKYTMFGGLSKTKSIDLSSFDTSRVTNMSCMFNGCRELTALDLSGFNTSNVTNISGMFVSCENIKELDLSSFDTSNVTNMKGMFYDCYNLTHLNLSGLDTSSVMDISDMFRNCRSLTDINMSGFDVSCVLDMRSLFAGCHNLKTIIMDIAVNQDTKTNRMFEGCRAEIIQTP